MNYRWIMLCACLSMGILHGQEIPEGQRGDVPEQANDSAGEEGQLPQPFFTRWSAQLDGWTQWLNPFFERSLSTMPGIASIYPNYKGYIKGITLLGVAAAVACSKPIKYMVRTVKEWYAISDDAYPARLHSTKEPCKHQCLVCSSDET